MAPATPLGGPVAVLRVSGSDLSFLEKVLGPLPEANSFAFRKIRFRTPSGEDFREKALVLRFRAPHSFTGEDVVEVQGHGVEGVVSELIEEICRQGASPALPGEFSFRAVLNEKMTLEEAEALQTALSTEGLGASMASRLLDVQAHAEEGVASRFEEALAKLSSARGRVEAAIDFPEAEEEQARDIESALVRVGEVQSSLQALMTSYEIFSAAAGLPVIAICGRPNAGKSTLLNLLSGGERALVSPVAGTTRDIVEITYRLPSGRKVRILDTAGLREFGRIQASADELELRGIALGREAIRKSSVVLLVERAGSTEASLAADFTSKPLLVLRSHADLVQEGGDASFDLLRQGPAAKAWLDRKLEAVLTSPALPSQEEALISKRQAKLLEAALSELTHVCESLKGREPIELAGERLRTTEELLKRSLGRPGGDEYIGEIFRQFCLGK